LTDIPFIQPDQGALILVNKPLTWTSFDVVQKIKWTLKFFYGKDIKVGHAGTLDPLASGILVICTGKMTRQIDQFQAGEKEYTGTFYMGATTPSLDHETPIEKEFPAAHLNLTLLQEAAGKFLGEQDQIPPLHSAKWIDGKRAYKIARAGKEADVPPARVTIHEFEITAFEPPLVHFRVVCSKGTYIRSLARDFGLACNSAAFLNSLVRTRSGSFSLKDAYEVEEFCALFPAQFSREEVKRKK
jgi:tRNA pseudouridine55 synthase